MYAIKPEDMVKPGNNLSLFNQKRKFSANRSESGYSDDTEKFRARGRASNGMHPAVKAVVLLLVMLVTFAYVRQPVMLMRVLQSPLLDEQSSQQELALSQLRLEAHKDTAVRGAKKDPTIDRQMSDFMRGGDSTSGSASRSLYMAGTEYRRNFARDAILSALLLGDKKVMVTHTQALVRVLWLLLAMPIR
jgi:hypothetical protein